MAETSYLPKSKPMKPYFADDSVTIYHGDCREILPTLEPVDLVLTDPPYGISYKASQPNAIDYGKIVNDDCEFNPGFLLGFPNIVLWGANNFCHLLPSRGGWLVWDKRVTEAADKMMGSPFELAWCNKKTLYKICRLQHGGAKNADARNGDVANQKRVHPTQKPVALMRWCIGQVFKGGDFSAAVIIDPFMGSGSTLRAAKDLGFRAIGIEIEEKYCEIAAERMSQKVLQFD